MDPTFLLCQYMRIVRFDVNFNPVVILIDNLPALFTLVELWHDFEPL